MASAVDGREAQHADLVSRRYFGDVIGAAIAVVIIILVRGLPDKAETEAAEGGALPL
jgi:hypothetical protein